MRFLLNVNTHALKTAVFEFSFGSGKEWGDKIRCQKKSLGKVFFFRELKR